MNVEEARQKLEDVAGNFYLARTSIMEAADAYALAAHVDACGRVCSELDRIDALCGEGWYCEDGREIEELG